MSSPCSASQCEPVGTRVDPGGGEPSGEGSPPFGIHSGARDRKPGQSDICKNANLLNLGGCTVFLPSRVCNMRAETLSVFHTVKFAAPGISCLHIMNCSINT